MPLTKKEGTDAGSAYAKHGNGGHSRLAGNLRRAGKAGLAGILREENRRSWVRVLADLSLLAAGVLVAAVLWVGFSYQEASSFNRLTGADVQVWDAMFVKLRVTADDLKERD